MGREGDPCFWDCATVRAPVRASPVDELITGTGQGISVERELLRPSLNFDLCAPLSSLFIPSDDRRVRGSRSDFSFLLNRNIRLSNVGLVSKGGEILLFIS